MLTLSERLDNESKGKEGKEDAVQFLEAGKDAPIALEAAKEPFDLNCVSCTALGQNARDPRDWI